MLSAYKRILVIKNLPDYTDATINTLFTKFGKILSRIFIPTTDPLNKGAIVELESEHLAIKARKELHGKVIGDSKLDVDFASTKEAQTLIDSTLKGSETKTSVLDRIITQKDLKDSTGKEGLKNNLSMTPEKKLEKEIPSGKRNLEKRIERNEDGLLEKDGPSYEEIQKKIKIDNNSLTLSPREYQASREGHNTFSHQQLEKFHEAGQTSLSNMKEERVNDQTHENHQVKIEHKNHTSASGNESSDKKKKEDSQDVVENLLANNPELKNQIGNPEILKAFFNAFRQEVHSIINKTPIEREQSEVKNEHKSSRSKRKSSSSSSSRHRDRSRRRKHSYSKSRSSSANKRTDKIDHHSHSGSKSSSKSRDRHRSSKKSNKKHRHDRDDSLSSERSRSRNKNRERKRKRSESSRVSGSRSRSKSRRHRDRKRRGSRSSGKRSSNKSEFPAFDEKALFEKFEQITKQFFTQKGINIGNNEERKEINDEKVVSQLDQMQEEHNRKPFENHSPFPQEKEPTNILPDPPTNEVPLEKTEHVHVSSVPEASEKKTPERMLEEKAEVQDRHPIIENISEAKSQSIPESRQKNGFQYSSIDQNNKISPEKKGSPEKPSIFQSSNIQDLKVSPVKEQERSKFVYSSFVIENRRQNLTLKLDKSPNPVSFKEMTLSSYKDLAPQPNSSFIEVSSWSGFNDNVFNTNIQNQQKISSTEEANDIVNEPENYASQEGDQQKANKEAGLKFMKLLHRQEEIEEEERKLRLECLGTQEVSRPQQEPSLENPHQIERRQSHDLRETLNQMRQTEILTHHVHRDFGIQQAAKSSQENVENSIDNDFIKKNNLEGFVKYLMTGGDLSTLKEKLGNLSKPN